MMQELGSFTWGQEDDELSQGTTCVPWGSRIPEKQIQLPRAPDLLLDMPRYAIIQCKSSLQSLINRY